MQGDDTMKTEDFFLSRMVQVDESHLINTIATSPRRVKKLWAALDFWLCGLGRLGEVISLISEFFSKPQLSSALGRNVRGQSHVP